jgi:hypothetical protein
MWKLYEELVIVCCRCIHPIFLNVRKWPNLTSVWVCVATYIHISQNMWLSIYLRDRKEYSLWITESFYAIDIWKIFFTEKLENHVGFWKQALNADWKLYYAKNICHLIWVFWYNYVNESSHFLHTLTGIISYWNNLFLWQRWNSKALLHLNFCGPRTGFSVVSWPKHILGICT